MSMRARELWETAEGQIAELTAQLSAAGDEGLRRTCPRRGELGDGSVGAVALHTTDNFDRIGAFIAGVDAGPPPPHGSGYRDANVRLGILLARLGAAREGLAAIRELTDERLDSVPPASAMRFADGERTLEQIVAGLLKHSAHQVGAIAAALS